MHRAILFHHAAAPYVAGDVAGFPATIAQTYVDRGVATYHPPIEKPDVSAEPIIDILTEMDRDQLITFAAEKLGMTDQPPADVDDEALRIAIRASAAAETLVPAPAKPARKR